MRLREHPKIQWPPSWSERGEDPLQGEDGILKDVDLIEPSRLLLSSEMNGKTYFGELYCFNTAFASKLHERLKPNLGRSIREVGELDL